MSEVVVVAGMSGAGRSTAGNNLEDLGWFVMDNLPPALIPKVAELADGVRDYLTLSLTCCRIAFVTRSGDVPE